MSIEDVKRQSDLRRKYDFPTIPEGWEFINTGVIESTDKFYCPEGKRFLGVTHTMIGRPETDVLYLIRPIPGYRTYKVTIEISGFMDLDPELVRTIIRACHDYDPTWTNQGYYDAVCRNRDIAHSLARGNITVEKT